MEQPNDLHTFEHYVNGIAVGFQTEAENRAWVKARGEKPAITVPPIAVEPNPNPIPAESVKFGKGTDLPTHHGKVGEPFRWVVPTNAFTQTPGKIELSALPSRNGLRWDGFNWIVEGTPAYGSTFVLTLYGEKDGVKAQNTQEVIIPAVGVTNPAPTTPVPTPETPRPEVTTNHELLEIHEGTSLNTAQ